MCQLDVWKGATFDSEDAPVLVDYLKSFVDEAIASSECDDFAHYFRSEEGAMAVLRILGRMGPEARAVVPALEEMPVSSRAVGNAKEDALEAITGQARPRDEY